MTLPDHRLNIYRPDLADEKLRGVVEAERYVSGTRKQVSVPVLDLRATPSQNSGPQTQILYGDMVQVFDKKDGWFWVQAERDGYTGYVPADSLGVPTSGHTHVVISPRTFVYPGADLRFPITKALSLGSELRIVGSAETRGTQYSLLESGEAIISKHLAPIDEPQSDYVALAETLLHTPYLWGGTSGFGIDCSGLVQLCLRLCGRNVLRDADMQQKSIGEIIEPGNDYSELKRGDLVFWKGHAAICQSPDMLIHASGHTMSVTLEPLRDAIERIAYLYELPTAFRRP